MITLQADQENQRTKLTLLADTNLALTTLPTYNSYLKVFFEWAELTGEVEFLGVKDSDLQILMDMYVKHLRNRVTNNEISPNTVPKLFKPMRKLLDINYKETAVKWKPIYAQFPPEEKLSGYKPWQDEQIQMMLKYTKNLRESSLILFHSSTGARVGVHDHSLLMKHMVAMDAPSGEKCYAFLIYADPDETFKEKDTRNAMDMIDENDYSHFVFTTPEATNAIDNYHDKRKQDGEHFDDNTPIFKVLREDKYGKYGQMSSNGFKKTIQRVLARTPISRIKKRNRFDVQIDHGFRKRFNTILKLDSMVNSNIAEKLMQHKKGLDGTYLTPTRHQCFKEFAKAISKLTVSDSQRQLLLLKEQEVKIKDLNKANEVIESLQSQINALSDEKKNTTIKPDGTTLELVEKILREKNLIK